MSAAEAERVERVGVAVVEGVEMEGGKGAGVAQVEELEREVVEAVEHRKLAATDHSQTHSGSAQTQNDSTAVFQTICVACANIPSSTLSGQK